MAKYDAVKKQWGSIVNDKSSVVPKLRLFDSLSTYASKVAQVMKRIQNETIYMKIFVFVDQCRHWKTNNIRWIAIANDSCRTKSTEIRNSTTSNVWFYGNTLWWIAINLFGIRMHGLPNFTIVSIAFNSSNRKYFEKNQTRCHVLWCWRLSLHQRNSVRIGLGDEAIYIWWIHWWHWTSFKFTLRYGRWREFRVSLTLKWI